MVLLAVVGSILLVGVVLLAAWKMVITIHDRREFARFQSARTRARYEMVSAGRTLTSRDRVTWQRLLQDPQQSVIVFLQALRTCGRNCNKTIWFVL